MEAFINEVGAFLKASKLDGADGQTLISDVDTAIVAALDATIV